jgi:hypothetical protein
VERVLQRLVDQFGQDGTEQCGDHVVVSDLPEQADDRYELIMRELS